MSKQESTVVRLQKSLLQSRVERIALRAIEAPICERQAYTQELSLCWDKLAATRLSAKQLETVRDMLYYAYQAGQATVLEQNAARTVEAKERVGEQLKKMLS